MSGRRLYNKYVHSDKIDVYIGNADFGKNRDAAAITSPDAHDGNKNYGGIIVNSRLKIDKAATAQYKKAMSAFQNVDFAKSKGKIIHLISVSNEELKGMDKYTMAEAIFHELKAHVDINTGDAEKDHKQYGKIGTGLYLDRMVTDPYGQEIPDEHGNSIKETVPSGSPAAVMVKELLGLKKADENKINKR